MFRVRYHADLTNSQWEIHTHVFFACSRSGGVLTQNALFGADRLLDDLALLALVHLEIARGGRRRRRASQVS